jgi:hexosaminidase
LKINDNILIDNDGMHSSVEKSAQVALEKGLHRFELLFVEGGGGYTLQLKCRQPQGSLVEVTPNMFFHKVD